MDRLLILFNCFFNVSDIERTVVSVLNTGYPCDIIFLENPSKYSDSIKNLAKKYNIYKHFICNENIEGNVFQIFCNTHKNIIESYKYIAMSEADVVLDKESIHESINILNDSSDEIGVLSIDLHLNNEKYYNLPINDWVPKPTYMGKYKVGNTGVQFIIFKKYILNEFINAINNKRLCNSVALGVNNYYGISDTNLSIFIKKINKLWIRTIQHKLDHIGWEHYILNNDEYVQEKEKNIRNGKIRANIDISLYFLTEL